MPSRGETDVRVAVTIVPVVDVQPIGIEVTDVDTVAVRIENLPTFILITENRGLLLTVSLYPLLSVFYSGAGYETTSTKGEQEVQSPSLFAR